QAKEPWASNTPEQVVTVKGKIDPHGKLVSCVLTEASPNPVRQMTADEFAKQFRAEPEKFVKENDRKWFILEGVIEQTKTDENKHLWAYFKGEGNPRI